MKNAFYFTLKALPVLKVFRLLLCLFDYVENRLFIRKLRLLPKFMTSQHWKQTMASDILHHINFSRDVLLIDQISFSDCFYFLRFGQYV